MANNELIHLIQLLEDPSDEMLAIIQPQILSMGAEALPYLNSYAETAVEERIQVRTQFLIASIQAQEFSNYLVGWIQNEEASYLDLILSLHAICPLGNSYEDAQAYIQLLRKKIWLECNTYLTTLEQAQVLVKILFYHLQLKDVAFAQIKASYHSYFLGSLINVQHGHNFILSMLHKGLSQLFEIPMDLVSIEGKKLLCAYWLNQQELSATLCYIDAGFGTAYTSEELSQEHVALISKKEVLSLYFTQLADQAHADQQQYLTVFAEHVLKRISDLSQW